jgi:hypothetical protein
MVTMTDKTKDALGAIQHAKTAMRDARRAQQVLDAFAELEDSGLVRLVAEPEDRFWEDDFDQEAYPKEAWEDLKMQIARDGYWMYALQARSSEDDEWTTADSIGGIVGDDLGPYEVDLKRAAIRLYQRIRRKP